MTNKEKARMTYNAIKYRKQRRERDIVNFEIERVDRVMKKNYSGRRRIGA